MSGEYKSIIRLQPDPQGFGDAPDELDTADFSSAMPVQHSCDVFKDEHIGLYVGIWDTESMVEAGGAYACDEFMWLIEGECQIRNNRTGEIESVKAGTPFVIPKGYDCQWQQAGYLRKYYVISEHPEESIPAAPTHEGIVVLNADAELVEVAEDEPFAITSGARPRHKICYEDVTGRFSSGTWACRAFESKLRPFPYNEFVLVQDGSITLTDSSGSAETFNTGDAFFVPQGVECKASVTHSVRLYFAIVKPG